MVRGSALIYDNAKVYGNAFVSGSAKLYCNCNVYDNASVYENAKVYDNAEVCGNAVLCGDAEAFKRAEIKGCAYILESACIKDTSDYVTVSGLGRDCSTVTFFRCCDGAMLSGLDFLERLMSFEMKWVAREESIPKSY